VVRLSDILRNKKGQVSILFKKNKTIGLCNKETMVSELAKLKSFDPRLQQKETIEYGLRVCKSIGIDNIDTLVQSEMKRLFPASKAVKPSSSHVWWEVDVFDH